MKKQQLSLDILLDWEDRNEESAILDGPFELSVKQEKEFIKRVNQEPDILEMIGIPVEVELELVGARSNLLFIVDKFVLLLLF